MNRHQVIARLLSEEIRETGSNYALALVLDERRLTIDQQARMRRLHDELCARLSRVADEPKYVRGAN